MILSSYHNPEKEKSSRPGITALAFLYKKLGRYAEAKQEWELIAETLGTEYGMTEEDNDMQWPRREIAQLESLLKEQKPLA